MCITYKEIESTLNPKYRKTIIDRRSKDGIPESDYLTGLDIMLYGCDLWLNDDFFVDYHGEAEK